MYPINSIYDINMHSSVVANLTLPKTLSVFFNSVFVYLFIYDLNSDQKLLTNILTMALVCEVAKHRDRILMAMALSEFAE